MKTMKWASMAELAARCDAATDRLCLDDRWNDAARVGTRWAAWNLARARRDEAVVTGGKPAPKPTAAAELVALMTEAIAATKLPNLYDRAARLEKIAMAIRLLPRSAHRDAAGQMVNRYMRDTYHKFLTR